MYGKKQNSECFAEFPIYSNEEPLKIIGNLPDEQMKPTVIKTIEDPLRNHPILKQYADYIMGDFNKILEYDIHRMNGYQLDVKPFNPNVLGENGNDGR